MASKIKLQLLITLDSTSSMGDWIDAAKSTCENIFVDIPKEVNKLRPRSQLEFSVAVISYKDLGDPDHLESCDFSYDHLQAKTLLDKLAAKGGGDYPEDICGALELACRMKWDDSNETYKVHVHIFDAPPHGSEYNDFTSKEDHHLAEGVRTADHLETLAEKGVDYIMVRCGGPKAHRWTSKYAGVCSAVYGTVWSMERAAQTPGKTPFVESVELENSSGIASRFLPLIVSASTCSIGQKIPSFSIGAGVAAGEKVPAQGEEVPKIFSTTVPPVRGWDFLLYPNDVLKIQNNTKFNVLLAVFPDVPRHENRLSGVHFSIGQEGVGAGATMAHILSPSNVPTQKIEVCARAAGECKGPVGSPDLVYLHSKKGVYVSVCRNDVPGHAGEEVIVGSELVWVKKGSTLVLWSTPEEKP
jgi:hypothetical protein